MPAQGRKDGRKVFLGCFGGAGGNMSGRVRSGLKNRVMMKIIGMKRVVFTAGRVRPAPTA